MLDSFSILGFNVFSRKSLRGAVRSPKWKKIRDEHLDKNPSCAACGRTLNQEVHHIEPVHINPDRELDPSNLVTLCSNHCHIVFGHFLDWKSWNSDVIKDTTVYYNKYKNKPYKKNNG